MRLGHALLLVAACGGRTDLGGGGKTTMQPDAQVATSTDYKVIWPGQQGLNVWRSSTAEVSTLGSLHAVGLDCTYDGRFIAVTTWVPSTMTLSVLDASGATVRTQSSWDLQAIRPDGMRAIVQQRDSNANELCIGTLDADSTFSNVRCEASATDYYAAAAYAPDGKTVLWEHRVYDPVTTGTDQALVTALEDGTALREIVPLDPKTYWLASESFSFDGSLIAYIACQRNYSSTFCDLDIVRLDTLESTKIPMNTWLLAARFTPDGEHVIVLEAASPGYANPTKLRIVDLATQSTSTLLEKTNLAMSSLAGLCVVRDEP